MADANQWRIELARKFSEAYHGLPSVAAVAIVGSVSYEMADPFSDLDLRVFWRTFPLEAEQKELREKTSKMGCYESEFQQNRNSFDEVFFFGGDAESGFQIDIKNGYATPVEEAIGDSNVERHIGVLEVIKHAIPVVGIDTFRAWQSQIRPYPQSLIQKRVQSHLKVGPWWLWEQFVTEGETLLATRAFRRVLERALVALAWLNQSCIRHAEYAKHTAVSLDRMVLKPENCWVRMQQVFQNDSRSGLDELRKLVEEIYQIVQEHLPEVDVAMLQEVVFGNRPKGLFRGQDEAGIRAFDFNRKFRDTYASHANVTAIVLSGDVSRRLANYAAIEITVFWMESPSEEVRKELVGLLDGVQQKDYGYHDEQGVWRERVLVGNTSLDVRHMVCDTFDMILKGVLNEYDCTPSKQIEIAQMRGGVILYGEDWVQVRIIQSNVYPSVLRLRTIQAALDNIFWWREQTRVFSERDALVYYPILIFQAQKVYQILMALNNMYLVESWASKDAFFETHGGWDRVNSVLDVMKIVPSDFRNRFNRLFRLPPPESALLFHELILETLDLVKAHEPQIDIGGQTETREMKRRKAWDESPDIL